MHSFFQLSLQQGATRGARISTGALTRFLPLLSSSNDAFAGGQEDASELLTKWFSLMDSHAAFRGVQLPLPLASASGGRRKRLSTAHSDAPPSVPADVLPLPACPLFNFELLAHVTCLACDTVSTTEEHHTFLLVDVVPDGTLVDCVRAFFQPYEMSGINQYLCETCSSKQASRAS
jgi:ubiquitin C-terminal hydrolase